MSYNNNTYYNIEVMNIYKNYKDLDPKETINKIRGILFEIGVLLKEEHREYNTMHSCRVIIGNSNLHKLNIGTNGKGRSFEFSLASGSAEFMERLENRILFSRGKIRYSSKEFIGKLPVDSLFVKKLKAENLVLDFIYDPREEYWTIERVINSFGHELKLLYNIENTDELQSFFQEVFHITDVLMIPSYSVVDNKEIFVPIELIMHATGSSGMCAGNSEKESILQGLCEIFERFAIAEIFYKRLTPPTIDLEEFRDTPIYEKIKYIIKETGYNIIIKDCSLGKGLPVIGVIIIDQKNLVYNFKLGSDFVAHVALERCLTEVYQSASGFRGIPLNFCLEYDESDGSMSQEQIDGYFYDIITTGSGFWPLSILESEFSYQFEGFDVLMGLSNDEDLKYALHIVRELDYKIYIRNNSILGFPAHYIFIPGMSQTTMNKSSYELLYNKNGVQNLSLIAKLGEITKDQAKELACSIEYSLNLKIFGFGDVSNYTLFNTDLDLKEIDVNLMLSMLFYFINEYEKSKYYIDAFLEGKTQDYLYYFVVSDFIQFRYIKNIELDDVSMILINLYGEAIVLEVISDLDDPDKIFQYHDFPTCFNCENCKVSNTCQFFDIIKIEKNINDILMCNYIEQINTSTVVHNISN